MGPDRLRLCVVLVAGTACASPGVTPEPCSILCSFADGCPSSMSCGADGYCHGEGDDEDCSPPAPDAMISGPDAAPLSDAAESPDAIGVEPPPDAQPPADAAPLPCEGGDYAGVDTTTGHCYVLFLYSANWWTAQAACSAMDPAFHLITINDWREEDIAWYLAGSGKIWIGLGDGEVEGVWRWVTGESGVWFWQGGEPNDDGTEDCAELDGDEGGRWNDENCGDGRWFVCERD
jgi:hypothetical protein